MSGALGTLMPDVRTLPPGPRSRKLATELRAYESRNVTYVGPDFPVFWEEARGANVRDVDGNIYVDLTAAFAVAGSGHAHPAIVAAIRRQAGRLVHGMGDVHPPAVKVELLRELAAVTPGGLARSILASSGAEAVEAALKTALLATGRPKVAVFEGGYHGLTYGALPLSGREDFRAPFTRQLRENGVFVPYPRPGGASVDEVVSRLRKIGEDVGAVLAEPVQGRGGDVVPPVDFLPRLRELCDERGWLLILDEIYTGFGRAGRWFACEHAGVVPDLMAVGKALSGGLPFAACIGTERVMDAWPASSGEALHTSTFLGNPLACAAALASIRTLREEGLIARSAELGARLMERMREIFAGNPRVAEVRGLGMMIGIELVREDGGADADLTRRVMIGALRRGALVLGGGVEGNVLSLSPPFVLTDDQAEAAIRVLAEVVREESGRGG